MYMPASGVMARAHSCYLLFGYFVSLYPSWCGCPVQALVSACERCVESLQPSSIDPSASMAVVTQEYQRLVGGRR